MDDIKKIADKYASEYYAEEHLTQRITHEEFDTKVMVIAERMHRDGYPQSDITEVSEYLTGVGEGLWCLDPRMVKAFRRLRDNVMDEAYEILSHTPAFLISRDQFSHNPAIVLLVAILRDTPVGTVHTGDAYGQFSLSTDDLIVDTLRLSGYSQDKIDIYNTHGISMKCI